MPARARATKSTSRRQAEPEPLSMQKQYFGDFRSRVTKILTQKSMTHTDAEQEVWEELEEELLDVQNKGALAATS